MLKMFGKDHDCVVSVEEGRAGGNLREVQSSDSDASVVNGQTVFMVDEDCPSDYIKARLKSWEDDILSEYKETKGTSRTKIQKEPDVLLKSQKLNKYFEPRMISVGPFNQRGKELKLQMTEDMKLKVAVLFIKYHLKADKERLYVLIRKEIKGLRECYVPEATECYDDDELALMFLVDGCVVLNFIENFADSTPIPTGLELLERKDDFRFAMDLLLLENQLPYKVLDILITSCKHVKEAKELRESVKKFVFVTAHIIKTGQNSELSMPEEPIHLLDLLWRSFNQPDKTNEKFVFMELIRKKEWPQDMIDIVRMLFFPLIWFVRRILLVIVIRLIYVIHRVIEPHRRTLKVTTLHKVEELKIAGIELMPSDTDHLTKITFSDGRLTLPPFSVTKSTASMFLNLAAYEMISADESVEPEISSFIFFLSKLISKAEDVKELRDNKILYNYLDSDEEVLEIFKVLNTVDLEINFRSKYGEIYDEIQKHCDKRFNVWMAEFKKEYFRSPWTVIALCGAIFALFLAFIQAFYPFMGKNK